MAMVRREQDFYLRRKPNGTIAFRIKVPPALKDAVGRNELQMNIPDKRLAQELARCCQEHFNHISKVEPMVDTFNQAEVRRIIRQHMQAIVEDWHTETTSTVDELE